MARGDRKRRQCNLTGTLLYALADISFIDVSTFRHGWKWPGEVAQSEHLLAQVALYLKRKILLEIRNGQRNISYHAAWNG